MKTWWRHPFVLALIAPWVIYIALLCTLPDDRFASWRNDAVWPAKSYFTSVQEGVLLPLFGHLFIGGIGAVLLQWPLAWLAGKLAGARAENATAIVVLAVFPVLVFAHVKAVPRVVTTLEGHALVVRRFDAWTRWPEGRQRIEARAIRALDLYTSVHHPSEGRTVLLAAFTADGVVELGQRACRGEAADCLAAADADVAALVAELGLVSDGPPRADLRPDHHVLEVRPR